MTLKPRLGPRPRSAIRRGILRFLDPIDPHAGARPVPGRLDPLEDFRVGRSVGGDVDDETTRATEVQVRERDEEIRISLSEKRGGEERRVVEDKKIIEESTTRGKARDRMWTEITKDLVIREAIEESGYEYEETDGYFYVLEYLRYVSGRPADPSSSPPSSSRACSGSSRRDRVLLLRDWGLKQRRHISRESDGGAGEAEEAEEERRRN